jgi:hypothetical protein
MSKTIHIMKHQTTPPHAVCGMVIAAGFSADNHLWVHLSDYMNYWKQSAKESGYAVCKTCDDLATLVELGEVVL